MKTVDTYIGIEPFTVLVDDSLQLRELAEKARALRALPFQEKLESVKSLALGAMVNAYEQMLVWKRKAERESNASNWRMIQEEHCRFKDLVFQGHPLSYALEQRAGCCRYQGALFFVLGFEADLGDQHFLQAAPVNQYVNTVFNEVVHQGQSRVVSIFTESLDDKSLDYSAQNPHIFEQAFDWMPGCKMYSAHRRPGGLVIAENRDRHIRRLEEQSHDN